MTTIKPVWATAPSFHGLIGYNRWTLCLGAGASSEVVPRWNELTLRVVNRVFALSYSTRDFDKIVYDSGWALDSWVQAAANHYRFTGHSLAEFHKLVEDTLYEDLLAKAAKAGLDREVSEALRSPRKLKRSAVNQVCDFFENEYGSASLMGLVRWMLDALGKKKLPYAVISFNVESLFQTVFELFQRREHYREPLKCHSHPKFCFVRVSTPHPIPREADLNDPKVCIYHCHGTLVPDVGGKAKPAWTEDRVVFLEQDYLRVATQAATWPETLFMFHAKISQLVFVGLSMSDANIRRWLGLSEEFASNIRPPTTSRRVHYWITKNPDRMLEPVFLESMAHLGVRPAWIDRWSDLEAALRNLTAV